MAQRDSPEQKDLICQMIDRCNAETIYLEWDGEYVTKERAKSYVLEYGQGGGAAQIPGLPKGDGVEADG